MKNSQKLTEHSRTDKLIDNLDQAMEMAVLLKQVFKVSDDIRRLESTGGSSVKIQALKHKLAKLEDQLNDARARLREHYHRNPDQI